MKNNRIFQAVWIGPTNTLGDRVKITDHRNRKSITVSVGYSDDFNDAKEVAQHHLEKMGIKVNGFGEFSRGYILFTDNFTTQIK